MDGFTRKLHVPHTVECSATGRIGNTLRPHFADKAAPDPDALLNGGGRSRMLESVAIATRSLRFSWNDIATFPREVPMRLYATLGRLVAVVSFLAVTGFLFIALWTASSSPGPLQGSVFAVSLAIQITWVAKVSEGVYLELRLKRLEQLETRLLQLEEKVRRQGDSGRSDAITSDLQRQP